jgi:hypothetical protein
VISLLSVALPVTISGRSPGTTVAEEAVVHAGPATTIGEDRSFQRSLHTASGGDRGARRLAWSLWLLTVLLLAVGGWLEVLNAPARGSPWQQGLGLVPLSLPFATVGALIAARQHHNPIGWLLCTFGLVVAVLLVGHQYSRYVLVTAPGSLPAGDWAAWLAVWPVELTVLLWMLVLLLFPHGRPLSPRWRSVVWLTVGLGTVSAATSALSAVNFADNVPFAQHPAQLLDPGIARTIYDTCAVVWSGLQLAAACSLVVRLRRARGDERQQLKWFVYVGALGAAVLLAAALVTPDVVIVALVWFPALAAAIGIAIFRYRLYDIDRLINRTLVYGLLTALLGAVYAGLVLVLGQLFGTIGDQAPSWAVAGATLAVAALFQPARRRIQQAADRRFNRRKYDAAKTIEAFSTRLREQVDLDTLSAELLAVVDQTMQPTTAFLWLRPSARPLSSGRGQGA